MFTFFTDTGISLADLAIALETRGFSSLLTTEHVALTAAATATTSLGCRIPLESSTCRMG
jgi:alkanesulfonate monooxygenase SsuD/methylene tetrahydromethanopterin reductase-like flavin-dependent oxidoreductase (luciferase family)